MSPGLDFSKMAPTLPRSEGILNLSPREALDCLSRGALLVDLREPYETNFRIFAVDEVIYLPWSRFESGRGSLPRDRALVLADAAGLYGGEAARVLRGSGYSNIANLVGGMIDWDRDGLPIRKDSSFELSGQCSCKLKSRAGGNPLIAKPDSAAGGEEASMAKVLFLCVHNSARSQMAQAFLAKHGAGRFEAESAGLEPGKLNPFVVRAMAEVGIDISHNATKSVFDLFEAKKVFQVVVTVCSKEAAERCPVFPGMSEKLHWPFADPSAFTGSDEQVMARVRELRDRIEAAVVDFVRAR